MRTELKDYINRFITLSEQEFREVVGFFEKKVVPKKTILLKAGDICKLEAFVVKGCMKTYFLDKKDREVILTFAIENWWVSDVVSFQQQTRSKMYIETIEDTELLILDPDSKEKLLTKYPALEKLFRLILQRHLYSYQERLFGNIALTAEERYTNFLENYPSLPQRIPQQLIASYLGVSAEFLSRIRSNKLKK